MKSNQVKSNKIKFLGLKEIFIKFQEGLILAIGFIFIISLFLGVYAFVEPSVSPDDSNFYINNDSRLNLIDLKLDSLNSTINNLEINPGSWDCESLEGTGTGSANVYCDSGYTLITGNCMGYMSSAITGNFEMSRPYDNGWLCTYNDDSIDVRAQIWCCK